MSNPGLSAILKAGAAAIHTQLKPISINKEGNVFFIHIIIPLHATGIAHSKLTTFLQTQCYMVAKATVIYVRCWEHYPRLAVHSSTPMGK